MAFTAHNIEADPDMPLLYALRDDLGLDNPHFGCGLSQCGACTVHVDGVATRSCVTPVAATLRRKSAEKNRPTDPRPTAVANRMRYERTRSSGPTPPKTNTRAVIGIAATRRLTRSRRP